MSSNRKITFSDNYIYHIYNRGVDRRKIYITNRDYNRFLEVLRYYQYQDPPIRYSFYNQLSLSLKEDILKSLKFNPKQVQILAYCLMPNHYHLLIRQPEGGSISKFMKDISISYSKYFNTKEKRTGHLFGSAFKAVFVESEEQLLHVSRYIHINPVVSSLVSVHTLSEYPWSSLPYYISHKDGDLVQKEFIQSFFKSIDSYKRFVYDQVDYAKRLHEISHITLED